MKLGTKIFGICIGLILCSSSLAAQTKSQATVYTTAVNYETTDTGTQVTELFLTVKTDVESQYYIGSFVGSPNEYEGEKMPKNTAFSLNLYWAGSGTNLAFVIDGQSIAVYSQVADEEFVGDFKKLKTIKSPAKISKLDKEVQYPDVQIGKELSIKNRPKFEPTVVLLQSVLNRLGYSEVGVVDGYFGPNTEKGLKRFQKENKLPVNGIADKKVWDLLPL